MKRINAKNKAGYTFLEVIVATFVFALIMVSVSGFFANIFSNYNHAKKIQKNTENAQSTMNYAAKVLRTSTIISYSSDNKTIRVYDYSQRKCVEFKFEKGDLKYGEKTYGNETDDDAKTDCKTATDLSNFNLLNNSIGNPNSNFFVTSSSDSPIKTVGKVTIVMRVCVSDANGDCPDDNKANFTQLQTTVSLRDYKEAGL